jgi:hypothetical protein
MESALLRLMLMAFAGWWTDQRQAAVAYLLEENRILHAQLHGRRVRLTDADRVMSHEWIDGQCRRFTS